MKHSIILLLSSCLYISCDAFSIPHCSVSYNNDIHSRSLKTLLRMEDDSAPSDYDSDDLVDMERHARVDEDEDDAIIRDELKRELLLLASVTNRGEYASTDETNIIIDMVTQLEALNPTEDPARRCVGEWDLCLSSTQAFRSSPFFQSIRALFGDDENKAIAENGFSLHALATSTGKVARVRQSIKGDGASLTLTSAVDLEVGVFPSVPARVKGTVITTANIDVVSSELWEMYVKGTKVIGSNVPFLDQLLDDYPIEVPVGEIYERLRGTIPSANIKTLYVDESMRIARDMDDNFYVFTRA